MTDNLKTWPEIIYLHPQELEGDAFFHVDHLPSYTDDDSYALWSIKKDPKYCGTQAANIEYIRSDIANEREEILIEMAYQKGRFHQSNNINVFNPMDIYTQATLEKLK